MSQFCNLGGFWARSGLARLTVRWAPGLPPPDEVHWVHLIRIWNPLSAPIDSGAETAALSISGSLSRVVGSTRANGKQNSPNGPSRMSLNIAYRNRTHHSISHCLGHGARHESPHSDDFLLRWTENCAVKTDGQIKWTQ
jgi:hypothetical protein